MSKNWDKLRQHQRGIFSAKDNISALFSSTDGPGKITGQILDLSGGGLSWIINRSDGLLPAKGDRLLLCSITCENFLQIDLDVKIEIKWILDHPNFNYIGFGGQFLEISEIAQQTISDFVKDEITKNAQKRQIDDSLLHLKANLAIKNI